MPITTLEQALGHIRPAIDYWYEAHQTGILSAVEQIRSDLAKNGCPPGLAGTFLIGTARKGLWSVSSGKVKEGIQAGLTPDLKKMSWFGEGGGKLRTINWKLTKNAQKAASWAALGATAGVFLLGEAVTYSVNALIEDHERKLKEMWNFERRRQFGQFRDKMLELLNGFNRTKKSLFQRMNADPETFFGPWQEAIKDGEQKKADEFLASFESVFSTMDGRKQPLTEKAVESEFLKLWQEYLTVADQKFRAEQTIGRRVMGEKRIFTPEEALQIVMRRHKSPLALPVGGGAAPMRGPLLVDFRLKTFGLQWFHAANEWTEGKQQELEVVATINGKPKTLRPLKMQVGQSRDLGTSLRWEDVPIHGDEMILTVAVTELDDMWSYKDRSDSSDDGVGVLKVKIPIKRSSQNSWFAYGEQWLSGSGGHSGGAIGRRSVAAISHQERRSNTLSKRDKNMAPFWVNVEYSVREAI